MTKRIPNGHSNLIGLLAHPVTHVRAPEMYSPKFWEVDLNWHMVPFEISSANLADAVDVFAATRNMIGLNVTMPHKKAVFALCDELGPAAQVQGVVNTVRFEGGRLIGESFDGAGFIGALKANASFEPSARVLVVGAGGAGRAIVHALAGFGVQRIGILDRDLGAARHLAEYLAVNHIGIEADTKDDLSDVGLVVNATPLGLKDGDDMPIDPTRIRKDAIIFDIIAATVTPFMKACRARGHTVIGGEQMIIHQMVPQIAFWQGSHT